MSNIIKFGEDVPGYDIPVLNKREAPLTGIRLSLRTLGVFGFLMKWYVEIPGYYRDVPRAS